MTILHLHTWGFFFLSLFTKKRVQFFVYMSIFCCGFTDQAVVLNCFALLNLVAFLDSSGSPWEELVLIWVHYLIVGSALPQCARACQHRKWVECYLVFTISVSLHLFFIGSCIWTESPGFYKSSSLVSCLAK